MTYRQIAGLLPAQSMAEGADARVHRTIGTRALSVLDPFLLLDEFELADTAAGFPDHPHRGFETVTYMFEGEIEHRDAVGHRGVIGPGDTQWMTAGRGIVHSEKPVKGKGTIRGLQLWVNLPSADKMICPKYRDARAADVPVVTGEGYSARLIAGSLGGARGPIGDITVAPLYAIVTLTGGKAMLDVPEGHTAFLYGIKGKAQLVNGYVPPRHLAVLTDGQGFAVEGEAGTEFLLVAAAPIKEPVARYGPFVMNTEDEIRETLNEWHSGMFVKNMRAEFHKSA